MFENLLTLSGNVATDLRCMDMASGARLVTFRVASTARRQDPKTGEWYDSDTLWANVNCWRHLADNVLRSLHKGQPVCVAGRPRIRSWRTDDGRPGTSLEIDAVWVAHDLNRGVSTFERTTRRTPAPVAAVPESPPRPVPTVATSPDGEAA